MRKENKLTYGDVRGCIFKNTPYIDSEFKTLLRKETVEIVCSA
jgi:hypothetical protein